MRAGILISSQLSLNHTSAWHSVGASCEPVIMQGRKQKTHGAFSGSHTTMEGRAGAPGAEPKCSAAQLHLLTGSCAADGEYILFLNYLSIDRAL